MDIELKTCSKCGEVKPLNEFPWRTSENRELNGRHGQCRQCLTEYRREHFKKKSGTSLTNAEIQSTYRQKHPDRVKAKNAVKTAIAKGSLERLPYCENCGKWCKVEAHHFDYEEPLNVQWLCKKCHTTEHLTEV